ncbi:MAG: hypothetical protein N2043_01515 [Ignavibacterium sp.]|nr:hypothetical protein [Ignavibacterium sp.]
MYEKPFCTQEPHDFSRWEIQIGRVVERKVTYITDCAQQERYVVMAIV